MKDENNELKKYYDSKHNTNSFELKELNVLLAVSVVNDCSVHFHTNYINLFTNSFIYIDIFFFTYTKTAVEHVLVND